MESVKISQNVDRISAVKMECAVPFEEEIDETKRKSRNLSEKRRRDQFNELINELNDVISSNNRKMDKSTILKTAIHNLKIYHQNVTRSKRYEISEEWKPSFLTNDEYAYLMLQSINGFLLVFSSSGKILYSSSTLADILGYTMDELLQLDAYELLSQTDRSCVDMFYISGIGNICYPDKNWPLRMNCQLLKKCNKTEKFEYESAELIGHIKEARDTQDTFSQPNKFLEFNKQLLFVGVVKLTNPQFYCEITLRDQRKIEFVSHHNFEWKFLFLDDRASAIIGYSPFEVLGTSGYDYYHIDDLDNVTSHHKTLMSHNEGVSGYYRFMTKGHQWIWLQTKSYINRRHFNSRVEYIVCTHRVVSPGFSNTDDEAEPKTLSAHSNYSNNFPSDNNKTSLSSWPSTTSGGEIRDLFADSNNYDDEEKKSPDVFTSTEDNGGSSSVSNQEVYSKRHKMFRKHKLEKSRIDRDRNSSSDNGICSTKKHSFGSINPQTLALQGDTPHLFPIQINQSDEAKLNENTLEDALQKKYTELQRIIADRTEELKAVSRQLYLTRRNNQQQKSINVQESLMNQSNDRITDGDVQNTYYNRTQEDTQTMRNPIQGVYYYGNNN